MTCDLELYQARVGVFNPCRPTKTQIKKVFQNPTKIQLSPSQYFVAFLLVHLLATLQTNNNCVITLLNFRPVHNKIVSGILVVFLHALLLTCGDIHPNPGPPIAPTEPLSCYFLVAQRITKINTHQYKLREFKELIYTINPALMGKCISETWLNPHIINEQVVSETDQFQQLVIQLHTFN